MSTGGKGGPPARLYALVTDMRGTECNCLPHALAFDAVTGQHISVAAAAELRVRIGQTVMSDPTKQIQHSSGQTYQNIMMDEFNSDPEGCRHKMHRRESSEYLGFLEIDAYGRLMTTRERIAVYIPESTGIDFRTGDMNHFTLVSDTYKDDWAEADGMRHLLRIGNHYMHLAPCADPWMPARPGPRALAPSPSDTGARPPRPSGCPEPLRRSKRLSAGAAAAALRTPAHAARPDPPARSRQPGQKAAPTAPEPRARTARSCRRAARSERSSQALATQHSRADSSSDEIVTVSDKSGYKNGSHVNVEQRLHIVFGDFGSEDEPEESDDGDARETEQRTLGGDLLAVLDGRPGGEGDPAENQDLSQQSRQQRHTARMLIARAAQPRVIPMPSPPGECPGPECPGASPVPILDQNLTEADTEALHDLIGRQVLVDFNEGAFLGRVTECMEPTDSDESWLFKVVFEDEDVAEYTLRELKAHLLPRDTSASDGDRLSNPGVWKQSKIMYNRIRIALNGGTFPTTGDAPELIPLLRIIFRFAPRTRRPDAAISVHEIKKRLKRFHKRYHADKTSGLSANRRHLARRIFAAGTYLAALFLNYRDPSEAPPNDSPLLAEFPVYGEQEFAEAAGVDEESLTPPDPPMPPMPNQDANAAAGDSSTARAAQGGQWDLHGLDAPNDPDPALDPKRLPNDFACIDAFSLDTCKLSPFQHAQTLPKEIFSDHAAAFSKVLGELLEGARIGGQTATFYGIPLVLRLPAAYVPHQVIGPAAQPSRLSDTVRTVPSGRLWASCQRMATRYREGCIQASS